ncbi:bifunctional ADP-dependent NAD(P)H-hydrate dehydratase/NAD(P)H-hydrate epimerase [Desulfuromonas carbonis]|uniref:bifunctional ADP-dependent NAD(P)H-hydrate dehydratase/NAD(P)H-hydrate epimerase n=1 Tax=Desulfuromonas sp. DDH964 TaxID=1823759 RepID=UPI00078D52A2|nr:bifunctional ADP-dependent NAD(P)H-hydrate dehydratase/NAD(P)H-hydrate epimerase [Desulfuromonas sp. DDH964]AMV71601.1 ATP-binding protein YjeF [Desulfuromonas sp. DDH964]
MKLLTARQMRDLDRRAIEEFALPGVVLMENAGRAAAEHADRRFAAAFPGPVLVLCGKGNNGGDGYVIARHLANRGWQVETLVLAPRDAIGGDAAINLEILLRSDAVVRFVPEAADLTEALGRSAPQLVIDALLGTGLGSDVDGIFRQAIDWVNGSGLPVLAVDIPSGLDADSGRVHGVAVHATLTVTFACAKLGQMLHPGTALVGDLEVADIGMPRGLLAQVPDALVLVDRREAARLLPARPVAGHKGTFGHLLVVAGSTGKSGAAALTAAAGMRGGAGLVTLATAASERATMAGMLTEVMTAALPESGGGIGLQAQALLRDLAAGKEALALGPGLGQAPETAALVRALVAECPLPLVLDADGLNALAGHLEPLARREAATILTPHPGEMARLIGGTVRDVESDRVNVARNFAQQHRVVLVLKGARTIVACPDGQLRINASGNPGMASGGMGDLLTGLLGALLAQGMQASDAAVLGVFLHGLAGDRLAARQGMAGLLASDLLRELPAARFALTQQET